MNSPNKVRTRAEERALIMCAYYAHIQQIMGPQQFREWFRTIRFFERERGWYFLSPGGLAVGPYTTERIAESQAVRLAKILKSLDARQSAHIAVIEFALGNEAV